MKKLIILIAQIQRPNDTRLVLDCDSYLVEDDPAALEEAVNDFRGKIETDGFMIKDILCHIPPPDRLPC